MKILQDNCFLLHKLPYKNTSFIATLLTENFGVIRVVANGSNRANKNGIKIRPLEYFCQYNANWKQGNQMHGLRNYEPIPLGIQLLPPYMMTFSVINELIINHLPYDTDSADLFILYKQQLQQVNNFENKQPSKLEFLQLLNPFLNKILDILGMGVDWQQSMPDKIIADSYYIFLDTGRFVIGNPNNPDAIMGKDLSAINRINDTSLQLSFKVMSLALDKITIRNRKKMSQMPYLQMLINN